MPANACLYLPTTKGLEVGQAVRVHSAGQDRNAAVLAVKGEKALVWYVLKNGERRERWVRSQAPVEAKDATTSVKVNAAKALRGYTRHALVAADDHRDRVAALARAEQDGGAAAFAAQEAHRIASAWQETRRSVALDPSHPQQRTHLLAAVLAMQADGIGNVRRIYRDTYLEYDPSPATVLAEYRDSVEHATRALAQATRAETEALLAAYEAGCSEKQIQTAIAKGVADAQESIARTEAWRARRDA